MLRPTLKQSSKRPQAGVIESWVTVAQHRLDHRGDTALSMVSRTSAPGDGEAPAAWASAAFAPVRRGREALVLAFGVGPGEEMTINDRPNLSASRRLHRTAPRPSGPRSADLVGAGEAPGRALPVAPVPHPAARHPRRTLR